MLKFSKTAVRAALVAAGVMTLAPAAAVAGEWRLNAARCPDLREDRWDARHDYGRADRREDRRDERVVQCPASAWTYVRSPHEARYYKAPPRPRDVIVYRDGRHAYRDTHGSIVRLGVDLHL